MVSSKLSGQTGNCKSGTLLWDSGMLAESIATKRDNKCKLDLNQIFRVQERSQELESSGAKSRKLSVSWASRQPLLVSTALGIISLFSLNSLQPGELAVLI